MKISLVFSLFISVSVFAKDDNIIRSDKEIRKWQLLLVDPTDNAIIAKQSLPQEETIKFDNSILCLVTSERHHVKTKNITIKNVVCSYRGKTTNLSTICVNSKLADYQPKILAGSDSGFKLALVCE